MFQAGPNGGNIYMTPGANGTVYIGHTDMLQLFQVHLHYLLFQTTHAKASCHSSLTCFNKYAIYTQVQDKILNTHIIQHALL